MKQQIRKNNEAIAEYRREFYNLYHTRIAPIMFQFEQQRKTDLFSLICFELVISGFIAVAISPWITRDDSSTFLVILICVAPIIAIFGLILMIYLPFHFNNKFVKKLKNACMPRVVGCFDKMRWYDCFKMILDEELRVSQLFGEYNRRVSADAFEGAYKDVPFKIAETSMYYESGSGKNRTVVSIFKGVAIKFKSNKNIKNTTIIATKNDRNIKNNSAIGLVSLIGLYQLFLPDSNGHFNIISIIIGVIVVLLAVTLMIYLGKSRNKEVLNEMKLEDPEFNKKYKAYSSDQIEGRYLITPAFIERFNNLQTAFGTNKAKCSFYGDEIMFAISTNKNLFEIGNLYHSLNNPKQMEAFFNELSSILALVDYFKLDEKTGL